MQSCAEVWHGLRKASMASGIESKPESPFVVAMFVRSSWTMDVSWDWMTVYEEEGDNVGSK